MPKTEQFISIYLEHVYFLAMLDIMEIQFPSKGLTHSPALEVQNLNHWTDREAPT